MRSDPAADLLSVAWDRIHAAGWPADKVEMHREDRRSWLTVADVIVFEVKIDETGARGQWLDDVLSPPG